MTLIIRTADTLTAPPAGSKAIPGLVGVTGIYGRFHADQFASLHGDAIARWDDISAARRDLVVPAGTAATQDTTTASKRTVKLDSTTKLKSFAITGFPAAFTIGLRIYVGANPTDTRTIAASHDSVAGIISYTWGGYGPTAASPAGQGAAVVKPAWVTLVATFDSINNTGKIVTNGAAVTTAQSWAALAGDRFLQLSGASHASGLFMRQAVFLDHAANDTEIAALTAALTID